MDEKFNRRFVSFTKSLDALAEARERYINTLIYSMISKMW